MLNVTSLIVVDRPDTALPHHAKREGNSIDPTMDSILFDNLAPNEMVLISNVPHQFLRKLPETGPHLFLNIERGETARLSTTRLFEILSEGKYYNPGRTLVASAEAKSIDEARALIAKAFGTINEGPRNNGKAKYRYVSAFLNRMLVAPPDRPFHQNHDNAAEIIKEVDAQIDKENLTLQAAGQIKKPKKCTRTMLRWIAKELNLQMQERAFVHLNAIKARERDLPKEVFAIIALTIREMVGISAKFGPTKIRIRANIKIAQRNIQIREYNADIKSRIEDGTATADALVPELPEKVGLTTVQVEYRRYDAWIRIAKDKGAQAADLEFGGSGKFDRPPRILDEVEIDHHIFDFNGVLGKTPLGRTWSMAAVDRFWICLALDTHSGYPVGFYPSFEPGGLHPALMALDHAIKPKFYVAERFPQIRGTLLSYGKPRKVRYDNGMEFVSEQMALALARVQIGFNMAIPHQPETKPFVERFFGTLEQDFVSWLMGSTGSSPQDRGARKPLLDAIITIDDFIMLFHMWLIEVYARRKQRGMDFDTPEERWLRGANSPSHRPQPLTKEEAQRWDMIPCLELKLYAGKDGIKWNNLVYQSPQLQDMRTRSGCTGARKKENTPVWVLIPLPNVGRCIVSDPTCLYPGNEHLPKEFEVMSTEKTAHGLSKFQWDSVCKFRLAKKNASTDHPSYEEGFNHLLDEALNAMGMVPADEKPPKTAELSHGRFPRFAGVLAHGAEKHALAATEEAIERAGLFRTPSEQREAAPARDPLDAVRDTGDRPSDDSPPPLKKLRFSVDAPLPNAT